MALSTTLTWPWHKGLGFGGGSKGPKESVPEFLVIVGIVIVFFVCTENPKMQRNPNLSKRFFKKEVEIKENN